MIIVKKVKMLNLALGFICGSLIWHESRQDYGLNSYVFGQI
jgi:hypothetical protein